MEGIQIKDQQGGAMAMAIKVHDRIKIPKETKEPEEDSIYPMMVHRHLEIILVTIIIIIVHLD